MPSAVAMLGVLSNRIVPFVTEFGALPLIVSVVVPAPLAIVVTQLSLVAAPVQLASLTYHGTAEAFAAIIVAPKSSNSKVPSVNIEFLGLMGSSAMPKT